MREKMVERGLALMDDLKVTPLDVMLIRMKGGRLPNGKVVTDKQFHAARYAAPYVHPRLQTLAVLSANVGGGPADEQQRRAARDLMIRELTSFAIPEPLTIEGEAEAGEDAALVPAAPPAQWEG